MLLLVKLSARKNYCKVRNTRSILHYVNLFLLQSDFFITYILTNGMSGFSLEVLQFGSLTWQFLKAHLLGHSKEPYLYGFPYYRVVPIVSLAILIGVVYAVVVPLLLPILLIYFLLGYAVYINQVVSLLCSVHQICICKDFPFFLSIANHFWVCYLVWSSI